MKERTHAGVHVVVEQLLAHVARAADQALVGLLVAVHEAVRVAVVARVERLAAHLAAEGTTLCHFLLSGMMAGDQSAHIR